MRKLLREYRGKRTQAEMAKEYGVTQQVWSSWEIGSYNPPVSMMFLLAGDAGVGVKDMFPDVFNKRRQ